MTGWKINVQQDYFARIAAKEYSDDAGLAVIREFAQNSVDASATRVEFNFAEVEGAHRLTVRDNGSGCTAETIQSRLLTPLGTKKEADAIGGFGKAKELLFFANPSWSIRTRDVEVIGAYLTVISFTVGLESMPGFSASVQLPADLYRAARNSARNFFRCSERPGVQWILNGEVVPCEITRTKRTVKDFGFARAYVDRTTQDRVIYLRTGGLLTALRYSYHSANVGRVILEITGTSSELLTPARDWFRASNHRSAVENWLNQLVVNAERTLAESYGDEICFLDSDALSPTIAMHSAPDVVPTLSGIAPEIRFSITDEAQVEVEVKARASMETEPAPAPATEVQVMTPQNPRRRIPARFDMRLLPQVTGVNHVVVHTGGKKQARIATRWLRKNAAAATKIIASWATAVHSIAGKAALPVDAIGFTFAVDAEAEFIRSNSRFALLINPLNLDLAAIDAVEELIDRALHETAHLASGGVHDENFVLTEIKLRRKIRGASMRGAVARALRLAELQILEEFT